MFAYMSHVYKGVGRMPIKFTLIIAWLAIA